MGEQQGGQDIRDRTFQFAVRIVRLCEHLDAQPGVRRTVGHQLLRSGSSIGANLEEAKAGHSRADFIAKNEIALKEARETHYWLRLIAETALIPADRLHDLKQECHEIISILTTIVRSTRNGKQDP
jgi:four helix bundle protein